MKDSLIKLRFTIDRFNLRDRIIILSSSLLLILMAWLFLLYWPQMREFSKTKAMIQKEKKQTLSLEQRRKSIENLAKDNTIIKLIAQFKRLKKEMQELDERIAQYEHRFISKHELAKLLYSILQQTKGVSIENFSNVEYIPPQKIDALNLKSSASSVISMKPKTKSTATQSTVIPAERTQYTLTLKGKYFSIMNYLKRLERLPWQLYWDTLKYKVDTYPQATAVVQFYTLRPQKTKDVLQ